MLRPSQVRAVRRWEEKSQLGVGGTAQGPTVGLAAPVSVPRMPREIPVEAGHLSSSQILASRSALLSEQEGNDNEITNEKVTL